MPIVGLRETVLWLRGVHQRDIPGLQIAIMFKETCVRGSLERLHQCPVERLDQSHLGLRRFRPLFQPALPIPLIGAEFEMSQVVNGLRRAPRGFRLSERSEEHPSELQSLMPNPYA